MASITFLLKEPKKEKESIIYLIIRHENDRSKLSLGKKYMINPKFWDTDNQRAIVKNSHDKLKDKNIKLELAEIEHNKLINDRIGECLIRFNKIVGKADYDKILVTINYLTDEMKLFLNPENNIKKRDLNFFEYVQNFISQREKGEIKTGNNDNYSISTINNYKATVIHLKDFAKKYKTELNYYDFTMNFYHEFKKYLLDDLNLSDNTINKDIKHIKLFLRSAWNEKRHDNRIFEDRAFKRPEPKQVLKVVLTQDEIQKFYLYDFSKNKKLEKVRDLFIIGCCTGLRYSDFSRLQKEHISGDFIRILTQKTLEPVNIPIMPMVKELLEKYNNNLPRQIATQNFNEYLRDAAKEAKLNAKVLISVRDKGLTKETLVNKHEVLTSHCARRTFATNAYLNDVPTISIRAITGHRTEKAFLKYVNVTSKQHAEKMSIHPFFNKPILRKVE